MTDLPNTCPALAIAGSKVLSSGKYVRSFWGPTAKIVVELPNGGTAADFLKVGVSTVPSRLPSVQLTMYRRRLTSRRLAGLCLWGIMTVKTHLYSRTRLLSQTVRSRSPCRKQSGDLLSSNGVPRVGEGARRPVSWEKD